MAINSRIAAAAEDGVQSPGSSNAQERRKRSEKPSRTVMAVITPERNPPGITVRGPLESGRDRRGEPSPFRLALPGEPSLAVTVRGWEGQVRAAGASADRISAIEEMNSL
jgi:hypothetical protein